MKKRKKKKYFLGSALASIMKWKKSENECLEVSNKKRVFILMHFLSHAEIFYEGRRREKHDESERILITYESVWRTIWSERYELTMTEYELRTCTFNVGTILCLYIFVIITHISKNLN